MKVLFNYDPKFPECLLSGSTQALNELGRELQKMTDGLFYKSENIDPDEYYNSVLEGVSFIIEEDDGDKIAMSRRKNTFVISGNNTAMRNLGESLTNTFDDYVKTGTHLHYDYLNGLGLTRETNISFVISCNN